jgi:hypothetical protein
MLDRAQNPDRKRAAARQRGNAATRRYREWLKIGQKVAPTPYSNEIVELLLDLGWLELAASEDRREVGAAIFRMLADTAARHRDA